MMGRPNQFDLVLAWIDFDVPGRNDATFHEELVRPRTGDDVLELSNFFPGICERRTKADDGARLGLLFVNRLDALIRAGNRQLNLLVSKATDLYSISRLAFVLHQAVWVPSVDLPLRTSPPSIYIKTKRRTSGS
jgi:hypothetical protein